METIDHFNLRSFDLNLLIAFDALMQERSVTRAAARLKIRQPAMSHNVATLRMLFQDDLFVRVGQAMQPTPRAVALAAPIRLALNQAQAALMSRDVFRPEAEVRTFRLGLSSELELVLLPDLTARLQRIAPGIRIHAKVAGPDQVDGMLDSGAIDLAVGCSHCIASRYASEVLFEAEVMCCFNPDLLPFSAPIDRDTYLGARHAVVSQTDSLHGCVKEALDRLGAELDVVMAAPDFLTVLSAAKRAPLLATISARVARRYAPLLGLAASPVPLSLTFPPVTMVWPTHTDRDPAGAWLRDQIRACVSGLGERSPPKAPEPVAAAS
ncbi:MAG TPA: LysR family transcriptional regulator [Alphaproteobacteria bacterium]|nr:LysR family transcriptional regulator [Alphaproteobacteria bacterium]